MSIKTYLDQVVGISTNLSVLLRELAIVAVFCLVFFNPNLFKSLMNKAGISRVPTVLGDIDVGGAGQTVSNLNRGLSDSIARLQQIHDAVSDAQEKNGVKAVTDYLTTLQQQAQSSDQAIKSEVLGRQTTIEQTSSQSAKPPGWLFAGQVDEQKARWSGEGAKNIPSNILPAVLVGAKFNVTATVYLHEDAPSGNHLSGKVVGVVPGGGPVQVIDAPQFSHALAGGYFCWLKVQPL